MDEYDEVVTDNPFYKAFQSKAKPLYNLAANNRWLICIPRKGTTSKSQHTLHQFETHVLNKAKGDDDSIYQTQNGKEVRVDGDFIQTGKGFSDTKSVKVLFEETFFNPKEESYHVLCIDQPLDGGAIRVTPEPTIPKLETLQNCIDFLWSGPGSRKSRKKVDDVVELFNSTYRRLETESIRHAMDAANAVFTRAMQAALKEPHLRRPADGSKMFMNSLKVAIETYVMNGLYRRTFKGLCSFLANQDAELNKITRNLADLQVKDLGIKSQLCKNIPKAKRILSQLNRFSTPLEKIYVLKLTVTCVSEVQDLSDAITADDLLPVLVFLVVKSEIPNWLANLTYMYNFHFSKYKNDEFQFYLSSIEAAMEYVRTGKLNHLIGLSHSQRQDSIQRLFQRLDSTERLQGPSPVEILFEEIRNGNVESVREMLSKGASGSKPLHEQLCHPLCSCDLCEKLISSKKNDPMAVTVFSRDDMGSTVLHPAAEFDQESLLFELIKSGAVVDATNYHGSAPLHMACLRGHSKPVLMLFHYGANINAADNDGNTPMHLATANGHEKVVEALLLVNSHHGQGLEINAANDHGDTPLHNASRWGFTNIVKLLLEHGASAEARNKSKESPISCAANYKVQELLLNSQREEPEEQSYIYVQPSVSPDRPTSLLAGETVSAPNSPDSLGVSPRTKRRVQELEGLLKAVTDGDLEMVKVKLGISENDNDEVDCGDVAGACEALCHPLCQCSNCAGQQRTVSESVALRVNTANEDGVTCLHIASLRGYDRIVSLLLSQCGALPNCRTRTNLKTPLHLASQYNHVECVSLLLDHGARPDSKDAFGSTPLHLCCTNGHLSPAILLLQKNANVNLANKRGNTPLHESARWNWPDLATLLLHYGASVELKNKANLTCLQYAKHNDVKDILDNAEATAEQSSIPKSSQLYNRSSSKRFTHNHLSSLFNDNHSISNDAFHESINSDSTDFQHDERDGFERKDRFSFPKSQRRTSITNLFRAYEEDDKQKIKKLVEGIQNFDRKKKLRRVSTIDRSEPTFDLHLIQMLSIKHFDVSSLHHVEVRSSSGISSVHLNESDEEIESEEKNFYVREMDHFEAFDKEMSEVSRRKSGIQSHSNEHKEPSKWSADQIIGSLNTTDIIRDADNFLKSKNEDEACYVFHAESNDYNFELDEMKQGSSYIDAVLENDPPVNDDLAIPAGHNLDNTLSDLSLNTKDLAIYRPTEDLSEDQNGSFKVQNSVCHVIGDAEMCCSRKGIEEEHNIDGIIGVVVETNDQSPLLSTVYDIGHEEKVVRLVTTNSYDCTREGLKETHAT